MEKYRGLKEELKKMFKVKLLNSLKSESPKMEDQVQQITVIPVQKTKPLPHPQCQNFTDKSPRWSVIS